MCIKSVFESINSICLLILIDRQTNSAPAADSIDCAVHSVVGTNHQIGMCLPCAALS